MALTASTMLPLGTQAPNFELPDVVSGCNISVTAFKDKKNMLVMFLCQHCPYVRHIKEALARLGKDYAGKSIGLVGISSNDAQNYPDDSPEELRKFAEKEGFPFPFCHDENQEIAKAYTAACTPDFFLFDKNRKLVYRGQFDDSRPGNNKPVTGRDLREAIDAALADRPISPAQKPSLGCNIKWKPGNEPGYFR